MLELLGGPCNTGPDFGAINRRGTAPGILGQSEKTVPSGHAPSRPAGGRALAAIHGNNPNPFAQLKLDSPPDPCGGS